MWARCERTAGARETFRDSADLIGEWCDDIESVHTATADCRCDFCGRHWPCAAIHGARAVRAVLLTARGQVEGFGSGVISGPGLVAEMAHALGVDLD